MKLISILEEKSAKGFVGKINIHDKESQRHLGVIWLSRAEIIQFEYRERRGEKLFYLFLLDTLKNPHLYSFISEPELTVATADFNLSIKMIKGEVESILKRLQKLQKYLPSKELLFYRKQGKVKSSFIESNLLNLLVGPMTLSQLVSASGFFEMEIIENLFKLKKDGCIAIKSYNNSAKE